MQVSYVLNLLKHTIDKISGPGDSHSKGICFSIYSSKQISVHYEICWSLVYLTWVIATFKATANDTWVPKARDELSIA